MIRRPPRSTLDRSSAASDVYKRQGQRVDVGLLGLRGQVHGTCEALVVCHERQIRRSGCDCLDLDYFVGTRRGSRCGVTRNAGAAGGGAGRQTCPVRSPRAERRRPAPPSSRSRMPPPVAVRPRRSGACLLYTSPSPRDRTRSRMPSSA